MKKFFLALILTLALVFVFLNFSELQDTLDTLSRGDWRFILLAILVEFVWLLNVATSFFVVYRALEIKERLDNLFLMVCSANFLNIIAPSGGVGGISIFVTEAKRRGYSSALVTIAGVLVTLVDYVAFIFVLVLGLAVLFQRENLTFIQVSASIFLILVAAGMTFIVYLGTKSADAMGRALAWLSRMVNRIFYPFIHKMYLSEKRAYEFAQDASMGLVSIRKEPKKLIIPLLLGLSNKALMVFILFLMFLAFDVPYSLGTVIAGFSMGYLFLIVSPTPAGVGFVEGALALGLTSLSVPIGRATVITLAYRGVTFWFPLLIGGVAFRFFIGRKNRPIRIQ